MVVSQEIKNLPILSPGDSGQAVKLLQKLLIVVYGQDAVEYDAFYDENTKIGVYNFQVAYALEDQDGLVSPETWDALIDNICDGEPCIVPRS